MGGGRFDPHDDADCLLSGLPGLEVEVRCSSAGGVRPTGWKPGAAGEEKSAFADSSSISVVSGWTEGSRIRGWIRDADSGMSAPDGIAVASRVGTTSPAVHRGTAGLVRFG